MEDKDKSRFTANLSDKYIMLQIGIVLEDILKELAEIARQLKYIS